MSAEAAANTAAPSTAPETATSPAPAAASPAPAAAADASAAPAANGSPAPASAAANVPAAAGAAAPQGASTAPAAANGAAPSASLYVGELDATVTEAMLYEIFSMIGPVISIRVCRDAVTRRSLGYAYVNYLNGQDAERALEQLNYSVIKGKPCRIMWSQRDPALRKGGAGNIFIKNLDETIDNKALHDTFVAFGPIISCKVATDETGKSRGYGFVHYETTEAADEAIAQVNGMMLADKIVFVGHYIPKRERQAKMDEIRSKFTNLYVKNLPMDTTEDEFKALFAKFGTVTSAVIQPNTVSVDGKELRFGFVNFEDHEAAKKALEELHDSKFKDETLYVTRAQKKGEREEELRKSYEAQKYEKTLKYQGVNLYVKNLEDDMDEEKLQAEFAPFGTITSCKIMKDDKGVSRGFGFVCFSAPDEATKAVSEMNGKMIGQKPLFVTLAQRKELRKQQLEAQVAQRTQIRNQQMAAAGIPGVPYGAMPGGAPMYYGQPGAFPGAPQGRGGPMMYPQGGPGMMMPRARYAPPGQMPGGPMPYGPMGGYPGYPQQGMPQQGVAPGGRGGPMNGRHGPGGVPQGGPGGRPQAGGPQGQQGGPSNGVNNAQGPRGGPQAGGARAPPAGAGARPGGYRNNAANRSGAEGSNANNASSTSSGAAAGGSSAAGQSGSALTAASLANASPAEQKQILGETIYPKIHASQPELAGKITGMLLEMDNAELLVLLEDDAALDAKVAEAMTVLEEYQKKSSAETAAAPAASETPAAAAPSS